MSIRSKPATTIDMSAQIVKEQEDLNDVSLQMVNKLMKEAPEISGPAIKPLPSLNENHYESLKRNNMLTPEFEASIEAYKTVKSREMSS